MKKKFFFRVLIPLLLVMLGYGLGLSRYGYIHGPDSAVPDVLATAQNILSFEPAQVKILRGKTHEEQDPEHPEYYYHQLDKDEQRAYREMLDSLRAWEKEFYLTIGEDKKIDRVFHAVLNDHPELYWVRNRNPVYKTLYNGEKYCMFAPGYSYLNSSGTEKDPKKTARIDKAIAKACSEVMDLVPDDAGEYEKVSAVYIWLIDHTEYVESKHDQSIAGVFWKGKAVCAGYASAMQYMLDMLGVNCIYVEGTANASGEGHAWNLVQIGDSWYYVDVTNADQPEFLTGDAASLEEHKTILMDYLCPFPQEYGALYTPDETFSLPSCTMTDMNFYVLNGGCFSSYDPDSLNSYFHMRIDNGAAVIRYKFTDRTVFEEADKDWPLTPQLEEAIQYYMICNGLTQIQYHYGALSNLNTVYYIF